MSLKTLLVLATLWYLSVGQGMGMGPCQPSVDFDSLPAASEAAPQIEYAPAVSGYYIIPRSFIDTVRSGILPYVRVREVFCDVADRDCGGEGSGSPASSARDSEGFRGPSELLRLVSEFSDWLIPVLATVSLGLLLAFLFPCVGFCFCCCRLCGFCGANAHEYKSKNQDAKCSICTLLLFSAEAMVFIGVIFGFLSNQQISEGIMEFKARVEAASDDSVSYITDTVDEVMFISTDQFDVVADIITCNVDNAGNVLGDSVEGALDSAAEPVLDNVTDILDTIDYLHNGLSSLNFTSIQLISMIDQFNTSASYLNEKLTNVSTACTACVVCDCPPLQGIDTVAEPLNSLNDFTVPLNSLESINTSEVRELIQNVTIFIGTIGDTINDEAMNLDIDSTVNDVRNSLANVTSDIQNAVNDVTSEEGMIEDIESALLNALDDINTYEVIRYGISAGIFVLILVGILVVFTCGVFCGVFGYSRKALPYERSSVSHCGAILLLIAIALCFLAAGLFLVLAALQFLVGTGMQKICNDLRPPDYTLIKEILDNPSIWSGSTLIGSFTSVNLSISDFLKECDANGPLWRAANAESALDLNSLLSNLTQELQQLSSENLDLTSTVDITSQDIIPDSSRSNLENIQNNVLDSINCSEYREMLTNGITTGDTGELLRNLTELADAFDALNQTESYNLTLEAISALNATTEVVLEIQNQMEYLNNNCTQFEADTQNISVSVADTFSELDAFLNTTSDIFLNEVDLFLDMLLGHFADYLDYAVDSIRNEVGRCERVSSAYTSLHTGICEEILDGFNGIWFSLGWCVLFFVPAIVSGVVLSTFFRRSSADIQKFSAPTDTAQHERSTYANAQVVGTRYTEHSKNRLNGGNVSSLPPMTTPLNVPIADW